MVAELARELSSQDPKARLAALKGMLDRGDAGACVAIAGAVPIEAHPQVRAAMAMVLGKLGGMSQAGVLAKLTTDRDARVRLRAVEALAALQDPACWATLVRVMGAEEEAAVRDAAAHFLMSRGKENLLLLFKQMVVADKAWKREAAVRACQLFNSSAVVPLLKHAATKDDEDGIRDLARTGLQKLAAQGNAAAAKIEEELKAAEAPPAFDLSAELAQAEQQVGLAFHDTYTGQKMPRVEIADHFADEEPEAEPPPKPAPRPTPRAAPPAASKPKPEPQPEPEAAAPEPPPLNPPSAPRVRKPAAPLPFDGGMVPAPKSVSNDKVPMKTRPCPVCGEEIAAAAKKCRFCNEVFDMEGLKQVQASAEKGISMQMPTKLHLLTGLQYFGFGLCIFFSFFALFGGAPGVGLGLLVIYGSLFFLVAKIREGSRTAWTIMTGLMGLGFLMSLASPGTTTGSGLIGLIIMLSEDVRQYCSK
jgi:hypothetical protein